MYSKYTAMRIKMKERTINNVKRRKYHRIAFLNLFICISVGEVLEIFRAVVTNNWTYYLSNERLIGSLGLYIFLMFAFTIIIIIANRKKVNET